MNTRRTPCGRSTPFYGLYFRNLDPDLTEEERMHLLTCDHCRLAKEEGRRDHYRSRENRGAYGGPVAKCV